MRPDRIAITGAPGVGKTTLARDLAEHYSLPLISAGDIARSVDQHTLETGAMADMRLFALAIQEHLDRPHWVLEGFPRTKEQYEMLPEDTKVLLLTCPPNISYDRITRRGDSRQDATPAHVRARIKEQSELLGLEDYNGWIWPVVGRGAVATGRKTPDVITKMVIDYLDGRNMFPY